MGKATRGASRQARQREELGFGRGSLGLARWPMGLVGVGLGFVTFFFFLDYFYIFMTSVSYFLGPKINYFSI